MSFILLTVGKDLRRRAADPLALLIWIAFPVLLGVLVSMLGSGGGPAPTARVLVADLDNSVVSALFLGALQQEDVSRFVAIERVELEVGRARIDDGEGTALLVLPAGFGAALLADEPTQLELVTNPAERILPAIVVEGLEVISELVFYGQRVLGDDVRAMLPDVPADIALVEAALVGEIATTLTERLRTAANVADSPPFELELGAELGVSTNEDTSGFDFARFILPGILFMSILFIAQGLSEDIWNEKSSGTLRRAIVAPHPLELFVAGKLLAGLVLIFGVAVIALGIGVASFGVPLARAAVAVFWSAYAGTALLGLFLFIAMISSSRRAANVTSTAVLFPLMMLGGSFLPFEAMPAWMAAVGVRTPNGIAVMQLRDLLFGPTDIGALVIATLALAFTLVVTLWLCARRLYRFATS